MRPRLLDDVRYIECEGGVYVENGQGSCVLAGTQAYEWVHRLAPHLNGELTLEELTQNLPGPHREMVENLTRALMQNRFVVDAVQDRPHSLSAAELTEYADEIAFIRYRYDSAEWRFQRVRDARILLIGTGEVMRAVEQAGRDSGWQHVSTAAAGPDESIRRIGPCDLVVQVEPGDATGLLARTSRICADSGLALTQVCVRNDDAWLSGVRTGSSSAESGWRALADERDSSGHVWLTGAVPALIAAQVTLGCFRHLAQMRPERQGTPYGTDTGSTMIRIDLATLETSAHRTHRPPSNPAAAERSASEAITSLRDERSVALSSLLDRAKQLTDPYLGPLRDLGEQGLPQTPLATCSAAVAGPSRHLSPITVLGWGPDGDVARGRALLSALAVHGSLHAGAEGWGVNLLDGTMRKVRLDDSLAGVAAGLNWNQAVEGCLLAHCEQLPMRQRGSPMSVPDPAARQLELTDEAYEFHDHSDALGLPAYSVSVAGREVARGVAATSRQALRRVTERALLDWQARSAGHLGSVPHSARWAESSGEPALRVLAGALQRATGLTPFAVPLPRADLAVAAKVVMCRG
jgi:hypothetical protein